MDIRVLLICKEGPAQQKYLEASKGLGAQIETATSTTEFFKALINTSYNGLMIDMLTKVKVFSEDKEKVNNILKLYPVIQLTFEEKSGQTRAFYSGQIKGNGTIEDFITKKCTSFDARAMRSNRRRNIVFNVILSKSKNISDENSERTVSINV